MENFQFKGFSPTETLTERAERTLSRIIDRAPLDANISATLEKEGELYHCTVEIGSETCPCSVATSHKFASIALDKAEITLLRKIDNWRSARAAPVIRKLVRPNHLAEI